MFKPLDEQSFNCFGERALPYAPKVKLADGSHAVPQQFIEVNRSLTSVEKILGEISLPENYVLFAGKIDSVVFLQVSVIGCENYPSTPAKSVQLAKIVYGRRWLLEPTTPTSEVVQTAFLAVKKVREHELREHVFLLGEQNNQQNELHQSTPFNTHLDLPLMAKHRTGMAIEEQLLRNDASISHQQPFKQGNLATWNVKWAIWPDNASRGSVKIHDADFGQLFGLFGNAAR